MRTAVATDDTRWTNQYVQRRGMRFWPCEALVRFIGRHYQLTATHGENAQSALEVGCGNGANLWFLSRYFSRCYGLDFSHEAIELCRRTLAETRATASLAHGSVLDMSMFPDESCDLVVDVQCVQHVSFADHQTAYREISRVLRPGGRFFSYHLGVGTSGYKRLYPECGPVALPSEKWVARTMARAGFQSTITSVTRTSENDAVCHYWVIDAYRT